MAITRAQQYRQMLKDGEVAIKYKDQRLTKAQQGKIKPANQGGGPNYLGKQKTVTVPKKWLSSPDHVVAELAYITPREQKILLEADLYGSLKGKPNRGPGGIMSLQGDMGSVGGPSGDNDGGNGDGQSMQDYMTDQSSYNVNNPTISDERGERARERIYGGPEGVKRQNKKEQDIRNAQKAKAQKERDRIAAETEKARVALEKKQKRW